MYTAPLEESIMPWLKICVIGRQAWISAEFVQGALFFTAIAETAEEDCIGVARFRHLSAISLGSLRAESGGHAFENMGATVASTQAARPFQALAAGR